MNFKLFLKNKKGEIATLLTLVAVGIMAIGAFAGSKLAQTGTRSTSEAKNVSKLTLDGRYAGCSRGPCDPSFVGNKDTGWCQANGVRCIKEGSVVCQLPDPWCDSNGQGAASTCTGVHAKGLTSAQICSSSAVCGKNGCETPMENWESCPADCAYSAPPPPPNALTSTPTRTPGGGPPPGGGPINPPPPQPPKSDQPYPYGYYVVSGKILNVDWRLKPFNPITIGLTDIQYQSGAPISNIQIKGSVINAVKNPIGNLDYSFSEPNEYIVDLIKEPIAPNAQTKGTIYSEQIKSLPLNNFFDLNICYPFGTYPGGKPYSYSPTPVPPGTKVIIAPPKYVTATPSPVPDVDKFNNDLIVKSCVKKQAVTNFVFDFNLVDTPTPTPTASPTPTFTPTPTMDPNINRDVYPQLKVSVIDQHNVTYGGIPTYKIHFIASLETPQLIYPLLSSNDGWVSGWSESYSAPESFMTTATLKNIDTVRRDFTLKLNGVISITTDGGKHYSEVSGIGNCTLDNSHQKITKNSGQELVDEYGNLASITFRLHYSSPGTEAPLDGCMLDVVKSKYSLAPNVDFQNMIDGINQGKYSALDASNLINRLGRVTGLQSAYCDAPAGECDTSTPVITILHL